MFTYVTNGTKWISNPYKYLDQASDKKGFTFTENLPVLGKVLFSGEPEVIEQIIQNDDLHAGKAISILNKALGEKSLITLDGDQHKSRKRILMPLMTEKNVLRFDETTVRLTREVLSKRSLNHPFSAYSFVREVSLSIIVELLFGIGDKETTEKMCRAADAFLNSFESPLPLLVPIFRVNLGPWSPWGRALRRRKAIEGYVLDLLARGKAAEGGSSLITQAMEARTSNNISDQEIIAEALALLAFGHDTAAATMAWAFHHIYSDLAILKRLQARSLSNEDFEALVEACLSESMRLNPVVVHLSRKAVRPTKIGQLSLKEGELAAPSAYLAHRNPDIFPEPARFQPDRFLGEPPPRYSYFPYGLGNRTCYGRPLAHRQMKLILSTILREFEVELLSRGTPVPTRKMVLVIPQHGTMIVRVK